MTRERKRESIVAYLEEECPECKGAGKVLSRESMYIKLKREILDMTKGSSQGKLRLVLDPIVCGYFVERRKKFEQSVKRPVEFQPDPHLQWEDYRIIIE